MLVLNVCVQKAAELSVSKSVSQTSETRVGVTAIPSKYDVPACSVCSVHQ